MDTDRILERARLGDRSAQQKLLEQHRSRLRRMVVALLDPRLSSRVDPSDVLQNALTHAALKLPNYFQQETIGVYPWLRRIVKNELIDVHRRHVGAQRRSVNREHKLYDRLNDESAVDLADRLLSRELPPSKIVNQREQMKAIKDGMDQMNEQQRELLLMRFVEEMTIQEIADAFEWPKATARLRVLRAIQQLTKLVT